MNYETNIFIPGLWIMPELASVRAPHVSIDDSNLKRKPPNMCESDDVVMNRTNALELNVKMLSGFVSPQIVRTSLYVVLPPTFRSIE